MVSARRVHRFILDSHRVRSMLRRVTEVTGADPWIGGGREGGYRRGPQARRCLKSPPAPPGIPATFGCVVGLGWPSARLVRGTACLLGLATALLLFSGARDVRCNVSRIRRSPISCTLDAASYAAASALQFGQGSRVSACKLRLGETVNKRMQRSRFKRDVLGSAWLWLRQPGVAARLVHCSHISGSGVSSPHRP